MSTSQQLLLGEGPAAVAGYQIQRSLRFNSADSTYLSRTPASAGNQTTWTWSGWVKRSAISSSGRYFLFNAGSSSSNATVEFFYDAIEFYYFPGSYSFRLQTTPVYRDPSAWYHIVAVYDSGQATSSNRAKLYVNGQQVTALSIATYPSQNATTPINSATSHSIGSLGNTAGLYFDGYITEINFIDGQALTPSSFGQTNSATGVWEPIAYTGTYGTNGFYLNFSDNSGTTSTTLGKDTSGNGNNWTPNNFSVTAGVGNDSLVDTPTPYGTDTGAGGEVRGNYGTWNPLWTHSSITLANGNLQATGASSSNGLATGTIAISSGKWYWESTVLGGSSMWAAGIVKTTIATPNYSSLTTDSSYAWNDTGSKYNGQTASSYGATYTTNDVIGIAVDLDAGTVVFYKNGSSQGTAFTGVSGTFVPMVLCNNTASVATNFGQRPFAYTAPSGFKALVTQNLSTPTVIQGDDYFNTVLYTGNGSGSNRAITGYDFAPGLIWLKCRSNALNHRLVNSIDGTTKTLASNLTTGEVDASTEFISLDSNGFTIKEGASFAFNTNNYTYAAWGWLSAGSNSTNTSGTITSTVRANTTSGFSVVTYTGNGSNATIGHGLGATPSMIIVKLKSASTENWPTYHASLPTPATDYVLLNLTDSYYTTSGYWNGGPTSTLIKVGNFSGINGNGSTYVAYCFAPVAGFSAFGSYTGNGSTDGPFVYTGFRPAFIIVKQTNTGGENWYLMDNKRSTFNLVNDTLYPNQSLAETADNANVTCDFTSNGFKIRDSYTGWNANGGTYIYAAFAENPFKYSLAR